MRKFILLLICASCFFAGNAQKEKKMILEGNENYESEDYSGAQKKYEESLKKKVTPEALFNIGDALYRQGEFEKAAEAFSRVVDSEESSKELKAKAYHNMGNSLMSQQKPDKGAEAYKNGLRMNPKDEDTRYNLSYALRQLQQQQQKQQSQENNEDGEEGEEENQEKQESSKGEGEEEKEEKGNEEGDEEQDDSESKQGKDGENKGDEDGEKEPMRPDEISKEDAARILNSLNRDEQKLQEKIRKKRETKDEDVEKDW